MTCLNRMAVSYSGCSNPRHSVKLLLALPDGTSNNGTRHDRAMTYTLAAQGFTLPVPPVCRDFRPERICSTLQGAHRIYPAAPGLIEKHAAFVTTGSQHQFTFFQAGQITPPEPGT